MKKVFVLLSLVAFISFLATPVIASVASVDYSIVEYDGDGDKDKTKAKKEASADNKTEAKSDNKSAKSCDSSEKKSCAKKSSCGGGGN